MPKKHRLTGAQIRRTSPEKRLNSAVFSLSITPQQENVTQVACVVSKKVSQKAVVRNRIKRRMREALRSLSPLPPGFALVLSAKKAALDAPLSRVREDVESLLNRLRSGK